MKPLRFVLHYSLLYCLSLVKMALSLFNLPCIKTCLIVKSCMPLFVKLFNVTIRNKNHVSRTNVSRVYVAIRHPCFRLLNGIFRIYVVNRGVWELDIIFEECERL